MKKNSNEIFKQLFIIAFASVFLLFPSSTTKTDSKISQSVQQTQTKVKAQKLSNLKTNSNFDNKNIENIDANTRAVKDSKTDVYFIGPGTFKEVDNSGNTIRVIDPESGQYEVTTVNQISK